MDIDCSTPHQPLRLGDRVRSKDGREWTVCYWFLDGVGGIEGEHDFTGFSDEDLPEPEVMFREPYPSADVPCIGNLVERII